MKIIALGDSFTEGFLVDENYTDYLAQAGHDLINLGINGDTSDGMEKRFDPLAADVLIVFAGTNDFLNSASPSEVKSNIEQIIKKSKASKNIIIIPPLLELEPAFPVYELINASINQYGRLIIDSGWDFIDAREINPSYIDGVHMRVDFHKELANKILEML